MVQSNGARIRVEGLQPVQMLAALVGLAFLMAGIVGYTRTGFDDFTGHRHVFLWGFSINPMHNLVHVVVGLVGLLLATGSGRARTFGWLLFLGYGVAFVWGLMVTGVLTSNPIAGIGNPLDLSPADNWLHFGSAVVGLVIAVLPARKSVRFDEDAVPRETVGDSTQELVLADRSDATTEESATAPTSHAVGSRQGSRHQAG
jgi:hypothetical protein